MATTNEFSLRRRVTLGGIPVLEMRKLLLGLDPYAIVEIRTHTWEGDESGQVLVSDGCRVPFNVSVDGRNVSVDVFRDAHEDQLFREQVRTGEWRCSEQDEQSIEFDPAAREQALRDFEDDRLRQERRERLMSSRKRSSFLAEKDTNQ